MARTETSMEKPKILLVFYSRSGHTRAVGETIADWLSCDVEEIVDTTDRRGVRGYLRSGFEAAFRRTVELQPMRAEPADYDLVVIGTPVWNASVSAPIRSFLEQHSGRLGRVAFFLSFEGTGSRRVFRQMGRLAGSRPVATLAVREKAIDHGQFEHDVHPFVEAVRRGLKTDAAAREEPDIRISGGGDILATAVRP